MPLPRPSAELLLMLLADARLPTAGHTQSGGLEPAIVDGLLVHDVPAYVDLRLRTVTRVETATAVVALHALRQGRRLSDVEVAWAARTLSPAMRATSYAMGRALARIVGRLWPAHPSVTAVGNRAPRSLVLAGAADACGLRPLALAKLVGYDDVQTVASAALKLLPLDPADVAAWVLDALPAVDDLAVAVSHLAEPAAIPACGAPQIEAWAEAHAVAERRLFNA